MFVMIFMIAKHILPCISYEVIGQEIKAKHVVHENVVGGSSMIRFPLVIAVSE